MPTSIGIVRPASAQDAAACVAIYRPYVRDTTISWEIEVPTVDEMAARIGAARDAHEWLVLESDEGDHRLRLRARPAAPAFLPVVGRNRHLCQRRPPPQRRWPPALHPTAAAYHRAWLSTSLRRHNPTQRRQQRFPSIIRIPGCRHYIAASNGSTTAGTTSHGCNSICLALPTRMNRPARLLERRRCALPSGSGRGYAALSRQVVMTCRRRHPACRRHRHPACRHRRLACRHPRHPGRFRLRIRGQEDPT